MEEAVKKAAVAWLAVPGGGPSYLVWCAWLGGSLLVVSGPGEQAAPGLADTPTAEVTLRGDHGGRIVTWTAAVTQLAGKRLNGAPAIATAWAGRCVVSRLTPADAPLAALPDDAQAAPPRPTPATRLPRLPFRLHKVRGATTSRGRRR